MRHDCFNINEIWFSLWIDFNFVRHVSLDMIVLIQMRYDFLWGLILILWDMIFIGWGGTRKRGRKEGGERKQGSTKSKYT